MRDQTCRQSPNRHSDSRPRRSRFDEYYSEYSGGDSEYYDDNYEDSHSDYSPSDRSRSQSVASHTEDINNAEPTVKPESSEVKSTDADPVVHSKNLDVLLAKSAACGP